MRVAVALLAGVLPAAVALAQSTGARQEHDHRAHGAPEIVRPHTKPLTLAELESLGVANHPAFVRLAGQIEAAQGRAYQAGLPPNPTVGYTADEIGTDGTAGLHGVFAEQTLVTGGKLAYRRNERLRQGDIAAARLASARQRILNGVRAQYTNLLYFQKVVAIREELLKTARDGESAARQLRNIGRANRPAELLALIELRQATASFEEAKIERDSAWRELAIYLGRPDMPLVSVEGDLEDSPPKVDQVPTIDQLLAESPEIQTAYAEVAQAQAALARESAERAPDVNVRLGTQYSFESERQVALAEVGVPLPIFNRNQGNIQAAQAELGSAQAAAYEVELGIRRRHARAEARFKSAAVAVESYRTQLSDATEAHGMYREAVDQRMASYEQVLSAQRTLFQLSIAYQQSLRQLWQAAADLRGLLVADETVEVRDSGPAMSPIRSNGRDAAH